MVLQGGVQYDYFGNSNNNNYSNKVKDLFNIGKTGWQGFNQWQSTGTTPWGAIGSIGKQGYNMISGKNPSEYSDVEQSTIYPLQGAMTGAKFGPWGALGGALYGLGYSFKDDLGLDDSNFLTQMLFPIGMGDGGGLRVNGKSILDIG